MSLSQIDMELKPAKHRNLNPIASLTPGKNEGNARRSVYKCKNNSSELSQKKFSSAIQIGNLGNKHIGTNVGCVLRAAGA